MFKLHDGWWVIFAGVLIGETLLDEIHSLLGSVVVSLH